MTIREAIMLEDILEKIDVSLKENFTEVYDSLMPGATEIQLNLLEKKCFGGNTVPEDLKLLYKWHNGQTGYCSLNQDDNRTFLPIEEVIDNWEFLNDPMEDILEPISKSWIPITYNGAGDHLVYETQGDKMGKIINYWHDDEDRSIESESLVEWAKDVLNAAKS
jgi:cell wall assembly regulator SMI1